MDLKADVVVVGGGAAGLAAAATARRKEASVVLIERGRLGGDCTWQGCVPSKALLEQARRVHAGRRMGLTGEVDFAVVMERVAAAVHAVAKDEAKPTLEAQGIRVLEGSAAFTGARTLSVDGTTVRGETVVLATGSRPVTPPIAGLAEAQPLTNENVFDLRTLPPRLAVLGGGPIGLELGQAFARLGSEVTILEGLDRVAVKEEPEASVAIADVLQREGVRLVLGSFVEAVQRQADGTITARTKDGTTVTADAVLNAVGRRPVTEGLAPERGGVTLTDRGYIQVDEHLETTAQGVYAAGDIIGSLQFTHAGYDMGGLAVNNALARLRSGSFETAAIPWVTFTEPEIGRVGRSEAEAYEAFGEDAQIAELPMAETDRGRAAGETTGFIKLVAGPRLGLGHLGGGRLVGATVVCPTAGEVVHELALAARTHMFTGRLAQTTHAYPSWSMAVREAAAQFFFTHRGRTARPARRGGPGA
jgi:pyruvate/2-oxoglutarate dehydrogenase complex dihydrolipoamide dehydrogenase (E3) component